MLYKYYHKGFTLIELMIVMAIIGILATIALPSYQDYIGRAQASEALVVTSGLKNDIAAYYWGNRKWPPAGHHTVSAATSLKGKYFEQGDIIVTPDKGTITTTFNDGVNKGKAVILTPTANSENGQIITWKCSGSVGKSRLPLTCQ